MESVLDSRAKAVITGVISRSLVPALLIAALGFLVILPIGTIVYASFVDSPPRPGATPNFTLDNYGVFADPVMLRAAVNSLMFALGSTLFAMSIGAGLAWLAARTDVPGKPMVAIAGVAPLFMSALVGALAYALIASPRTGYINLILRDLGIPITVDIYSPLGIMFVLGLFYAPYAFLFVSSALRLMNPELEDAAETHGATRWTVVRSITLPLVKPALLGAAVLTFVLTLENFPVLQVLGNPSGIESMPSMIFRLMVQTPPRPTQAAAAGMMLLVIMVALVYLQARLLRQRSFVTVSGKGFRPKLMPLGRWRWPAFALACSYLIVAVVLPVFALAQSAFRQHQFIPNTLSLFDPAAFSLKTFAGIFSYEPFIQAFTNSIIVGACTAVVGGAFHFILSYYVNRTELPLRWLMEYIAMAPVAVPALLIGMGFLWTWIWIPLPIYGTLTILVLAYIARFMPQGFRAISSTIVQVHRDLEESAIVAGASRVGAARQILVPLIMPGLASTMLLLLILSMRELSASLFLFTTDTRVLAIVIYEQWEGGGWSRMAAMSLTYSALLAVITIAGWRWLGLKSV